MHGAKQIKARLGDGMLLLYVPLIKHAMFRYDIPCPFFNTFITRIGKGSLRIQVEERGTEKAIRTASLGLELRKGWYVLKWFEVRKVLPWLTKSPISGRASTI